MSEPEPKDSQPIESPDAPQEEIPLLETAEEAAGLSGKTESDSQNDIYGVASAESRVYSVPRPAVESAEGEEPLSLEEIYSRRRAKKAEDRFQEGESDLPEPAEIPRHPFTAKIFRPLINPGMILKLFLLIFVLSILLFSAFRLFHHLTRKCFHSENRPGVSVVVETKSPEGVVKEQMTAEKLTGRLSKIEKLFLGTRGEIVFGGFRLYGFLFLFPLVIWGILAIPFYIQISEQTAGGDDRIAEWPDWSLLPAVSRFLWFFLLLLTAGIPGYFLFAFFGLARAGFVFSAFFLFPVFYLSTTDTDSYFCLLSKNILKGLRLAAAAWRNSLILLFVTGLIPALAFFFVLGYGIFFLQSLLHLAGFSLLAAFILVLWGFYFFRILGRLAWVIKDRLQSREDEKTGSEV